MMDAAVSRNDHPLIILNNFDSCIFVHSDATESKNDFSALDWLRERCLKHGSSYEGRREAFCKLTNSIQKAAILISESDYEMYFPLYGSHHKECIWIQFNNLKGCRNLGPHETKLIFLNGFEFIVNCNDRIIRRQLRLCSLFKQQIQSQQFVEFA